MTRIPHRMILTEEQVAKQWCNLRADMKAQPDPLLNPSTFQPIRTEELYPIFCKELAKQETDNTTAYFDIPEPILEVYRAYRPSPLSRAYALEKYLKTPAKIYFKFEGGNTSGSRRLITQKSRGLPALQRKRGPASGEPRWPRHARTSE